MSAKHTLSTSSATAPDTLSLFEAKFWLRQEVVDPKREEQVDKAMRAVFGALQRHFEAGNAAEMQGLKQLQRMHCVWTGCNFCEPHSALLSLDADLRPALFAVPPWLQERHQPLLLMLGVSRFQIPSRPASLCPRRVSYRINIIRASFGEVY